MYFVTCSRVPYLHQIFFQFISFTVIWLLEFSTEESYVERNPSCRKTMENSPGTISNICTTRNSSRNTLHVGHGSWTAQVLLLFYGQASKLLLPLLAPCTVKHHSAVRKHLILLNATDQIQECHKRIRINIFYSYQQFSALQVSLSWSQWSVMA